MSATMTTLTESHIAGLKLFTRGKVRDVYDLGDHLLIVSTDRLSAFDYVLPTPIPDKGRALTQISAFWFKRTSGIVPNHMVSAYLPEIKAVLPKGTIIDDAKFGGRTMLVKKAKRVDAECVVRGYLMGSGWKEYQKSMTVCGHRLPAGLKEASKLPEPIFTPSTKADQGHDENISREKLAELVGQETASELERLSLTLYKEAAAYMETKGLILADTKFEFGRLNGQLIVIDEMITPDSSRFWDAKNYKVGSSPESFDKQFVRDHLERIGWDKKPPVPALPNDVVEGTTKRYLEALMRITS